MDDIHDVFSARLDSPRPTSISLLWLNNPHASASYAALRHGGAPPAHAQAQLGLDRKVGHTLEQLFRSHRGGGVDDPMKPRFARHEAHVRAVLVECEFPVLPERRR